MQGRWAKVARWAKLLLAVIVIVGVGWHFAKILKQPELRNRSLSPGSFWIIMAFAGYFATAFLWSGYWRGLMAVCEQRLSPLDGWRIYFVSQLGKYVPGKALVIVMRAAMSQRVGARSSVAAVTAIYETLTSMAAGAMVAAILLPILETGSSNLIWKALGLLALAGVPILPGVFNRLAARAARPFLPKDSPAIPPIRVVTLVGGILQTGAGWFFLGISALAVVRAFEPSIDITLRLWLKCTAYVAVAYVAGFVALPTPGGIGVREAILNQLLTQELRPVLGDQAEGLSVVIVLSIRLIWTVGELSLVGLTSLVHRFTIPRP